MNDETLEKISIDEIDSWNLCKIGSKYLNKDSKHYNVERAIECFKRAEQLAIPLGIFELACLYLNGNHVKQDYKKAVEYFLKAVDAATVQNDKDTLRHSMYYLGDIYYYGKGIEMNIRKGMEWMQRAVDLDDSLAKQAFEQMKNEQGLVK